MGEESQKEPLTPEERSKSLVREEYEMLIAHRDFFNWELRLRDAGDYYVILVRIVKDGGRTFLIRLRCDDYPQIAPLQHFLDPMLFDTADEKTEAKADFYPTGPNIDQRVPLPVLCIKGHRDYYANGWHGGWTNPPSHDQTLYQHVVNVRNAIVQTWQ